jgi:peptidoglycan/xylan/chitin deacetylase (PgdA/CDA1 family)
LSEAYWGLTLERWTSGLRHRGLPSSAFGLFYRVKHLIPRAAQLAARRALIRAQGTPDFPAWPFDDTVAALLRFAIRCSLVARERDRLEFRWFWPHGAHAAAILTHDVESAEGLRNAVRIADLEQDRQLRSSFNIVGQWYDIDWGIVAELHERGFELGVHGVFHDRSLFSSREEFERQQPVLRETAQRLQACGFRSPATHRVNDWLSELPFLYDCTVSMSDPYEPQPGGCCSPWPFLLGSVVELPYTLPQDHTLFTLLRHQSIDAWTKQVELLERAHGLIQCLSHPDPGYLGESANEARYAEFLDLLAERDSLWLALPREVAQWWIDRDSSLEMTGDHGVARLDERGGVQLIPPVP